MARRKRKQKTIDQICVWSADDLFLNEETGFYLYMEPAPTRLWPMGDLLNRFYEINEDLNPIAFKLVEDLAQSISGKDWYAVFYASWHVRIVEGRSKSGPHQTQLWFKSQSMRKNFWIATLQLEAFYYNEQEMLAALLEAVKTRAFYISDTDRDICITV